MANLKDKVPDFLQGRRINDPSTWSGPIIGTKKDQFGFGTEQPISQEDVLEMEGTKLDKLLSLGEINQEEYKRLYEILQQQIQKEKKQKGMLERAIDHQTNIPYHNFQTGQEEIMER